MCVPGSSSAVSLSGCRGDARGVLDYLSRSSSCMLVGKKKHC